MTVDEMGSTSRCGVAGGRLRNGLVCTADRDEQKNEECRVEQGAT